MPPELQQPWRAWAAEPPEGSGLRECLLDLVGGQLRRLRERVEPSSLASSEALADRRVMALQRLQLSRSRELRLALDVLRKARAARPADHGSPERPPCVPPLKGGKNMSEPPAMVPRTRPARTRPRRSIRVGIIRAGRSERRPRGTPPPPSQTVSVAAGHEGNGHLPP